MTKSNQSISENQSQKKLGTHCGRARTYVVQVSATFTRDYCLVSVIVMRSANDCKRESVALFRLMIGYRILLNTTSPLSLALFLSVAKARTLSTSQYSLIAAMASLMCSWVPPFITAPVGMGAVIGALRVGQGSGRFFLLRRGLRWGKLSGATS